MHHTFSRLASVTSPRERVFSFDRHFVAAGFRLWP